MNNLAPKRNCPGVQCKLNWMSGYVEVQRNTDGDTPFIIDHVMQHFR